MIVYDPAEDLFEDIKMVKMTRGGGIQLYDLLHKEWCLSSRKLNHLQQLEEVDACT